MHRTKREMRLPGYIGTICITLCSAVGMISSTAKIDRWLNGFRALHFTTFSVRLRKQSASWSSGPSYPPPNRRAKTSVGNEWRLRGAEHDVSEVLAPRKGRSSIGSPFCYPIDRQISHASNAHIVMPMASARIQGNGDEYLRP